MRFLLVFLILLISCSGSTEQKSKVDIYTEKGILLLGNGTEPSGIDPHLVTGVPEHKILLALLEGLVVFNPKITAFFLELQKIGTSAMMDCHIRLYSIPMRNGRMEIQLNQKILLILGREFSPLI